MGRLVRGLRGRLTLTAAVAVLVALAGASAVVYASVRAALYDGVDSSLRGRPAVPASARLLVRGPLPAPTGARLDDLTKALREATGWRVAVLPGRAAGRLPTPAAGTLPISRADRAAAARAGGSRLATEEVDGARFRIITLAVPDGGAVKIGRPLAETEALLARLAWVLAGVTIAGTAAAAAAGRLLARGALGPVREMRAVAEHIADTRDLALRLESGRDDTELGGLARSMNDMLDALQGATEGQRRLVADVSHELRTPLTSLRTNLEVLGRADRLPPADRERLRADLVAQAAEVGALVDDLVQVARAPVPARSMGPVELDEVARAAVARCRRDAPGARIELVTEPAVVRGEAEDLERAVRNLVENAVKWSPPGAPVRVAVRGGEVTVRDRGPGVSPEDRDRVFERFYRAADARGMPGTGLGLAIVRRVADEHGGSASLEPAPGGGTVARLRIGPYATAASSSMSTVTSISSVEAPT